MSSIYTLLKVAKEINVGKKTIVEFLKSKGHIIDPNPTTELTEEQHKLVIAPEFLSQIEIEAVAKRRRKRQSSTLIEFQNEVTELVEKKIDSEEVYTIYRESHYREESYYNDELDLDQQSEDFYTR